MELLILLFCILSGIYAVLNFDVNDFFQPLMVDMTGATQLSDSSYILKAAVPVFSLNNQKITYFMGNHRFISACPSIGNVQTVPYTLEENNNIETRCSRLLKPSLRVKAAASMIANAYSIGYWLRFMNEKGQFVETYGFVEIFQIYYSQQSNQGLFTSHMIYPSPKIAMPRCPAEYENGKFTSELMVNEIISGEYAVQIVPSEHFLAMPWKIATLFDINYISVTASLKQSLERLNDFLKTYVNETEAPLRIFSGVYNKAWYWKVVTRGEIGLLMVIKSEETNFEEPCLSNNCQEFGLQELSRQIPQLRCCPLTEEIAKQLNLLVIEENLPVHHLQLTGALNF